MSTEEYIQSLKTRIADLEIKLARVETEYREALAARDREIARLYDESRFLGRP